MCEHRHTLLLREHLGAQGFRSDPSSVICCVRVYLSVSLSRSFSMKIPYADNCSNTLPCGRFIVAAQLHPVTEARPNTWNFTTAVCTALL